MLCEIVPRDTHVDNKGEWRDCVVEVAIWLYWEASRGGCKGIAVQVLCDCGAFTFEFAKWMHRISHFSQCFNWVWYLNCIFSVLARVVGVFFSFPFWINVWFFFVYKEFNVYSHFWKLNMTLTFSSVNVIPSLCDCKSFYKYWL